MLDGTEYFDCVCGSFDHTLRFVLDLDENHDDDLSFPTLYTEIALGHYLPWYKRIILGIKYIFGTDVKFAYNCWEINGDSDDPDRLIEMIQKLKAAQKKAEQKRIKIYKDRQIATAEQNPNAFKSSTQWGDL